jgi:hypothetical protein
LQNFCLSIRLFHMFEQKWLEVFIFNSAAYFISILFKLCLQFDP